MRAVIRPEDRGGLALDTVCLRLDPGAASRWDHRRFRSAEHINLTTGEVSEVLRLVSPDHGVNRIDLYEDTETVVLQLSSKALLGDYARGITAATLGQLAASVSKTGAVEVSAAALAASTVYRADVFTHMRIGPNEIPGVIQALGVLRSHSKLSVITRTSSLEVRRNGTGARDRLMIYDKARELGRNKNRAFLRDAGLPLSEMSGVVRFERNLRGFAMLRACTAAESGRVVLSDLLASDHRPVADLLDSWLAKTPLMSLFEGTASPETSWQGYERALGRRALLQSCDYDAASVRAAIVARCGAKNAARDLKPYLLDIARHAAGETDEAREQTVRTLNELVAALRN